MILKKLINKDLKLMFFPATMLFSLLGLMLWIPNYPYSVAMLYFFFPIQICLQEAKDKKDLEFSMLLPITRKDFVIARHLFVAMIQIFHIATAIIFALISIFLFNKHENTLLDANFTFFGATLIGYAIFNVIFFSKHFKDGKKLAVPLILGVSAFVFWFVIVEFCVQIQQLNAIFDGLFGAFLWARVLFLMIGIAFYIVSMLFSIKYAAKKFEKVSF